MLSCCHCLCGKERSAQKRLEQCYPIDNRPDPVSAHVRELITWGTHDVSRFETIYDQLDNKIKNDISHNNVNSTSVGVKILGSLIEKVPEINLKISQILVEVSILLIRTKKPEFLDIADEAINSILQYSPQIKLRDYVTNIVKAYLKLLNDDRISEKVYHSLSSLIEQTTVNVIPVEDILAAIKSNIGTNAGARSVLASIAKSVIMITLPNFADVLFQFFASNDIWSKPDLLQQIMATMITEMIPKISPSFFKLWLEQLPPRSPDDGHCEVILNTSQSLFDSIPPERLLSSSDIDPVIMVFYFVLKLPKLPYESKKDLQNNALLLSKTMISYYSTSDNIQIAHHQIWSTLPAGEEPSTDYDTETIQIIFQFCAMFDSAVGNALTKKMIRDGLKRIVQFFKCFQNHHKEIYKTVLKYLKSLATVNPTSNITSIIPTLLALQNEIQKNPTPSSLTIHTFIMCAMKDAVSDSPKGAQRYVANVIKQRLEADPVQADTKQSFFKSYFPDYKKSKKKGKNDSTASRNDDETEEEDNGEDNGQDENGFILFQKEKILNYYKDLNNRSSVFRTLSEMTSMTIEEEEDSNDSHLSNEESSDAPDLTFGSQHPSDDSQKPDDDSEEIDEDERERKRSSAYELIDNMQFKFNSNMPS